MSTAARDPKVLAGASQPETPQTEQPDSHGWEREDDGPVDETDDGDNSAPGDTGAD